MTRTGKCDICRLRKVKCDEQKPGCSACRKVGRKCTYSYGKPSVFVVEDPTQFSGHGKAKVAPLIYALHQRRGTCEVTTHRGSKHKDASQDGSDIHAESTGTPHHFSNPPSDHYATDFVGSPRIVQPWCPQAALRARFITILGSYLQDHNPFVIDTLWADCIPARIGYNRTFDLAVESAMDSFDCFQNDTYSTRRIAISSRVKALRCLRKELEKKCLGFATAQAIRMHFYSEVFLDFTNWPSHHLHMRGLFDVLKVGNLPLSEDQEAFWVFLQSTYVDEVIEATYRGTHSRFDTPPYLTATCPTPASLSLPTYYTMAMTLMHCWIQIPRLICLIRTARSSQSPSILAKATSLASALWGTAQTVPLETYLASTTTQTCLPADYPVADIIDHILHFNSVYNLMLLLHYWTFTIYLCGLTHTLHTCFPVEIAPVYLPPIHIVMEADAKAAVRIAQALVYALSSSTCASLPLLLFRILGLLQTSTGSWLRAIMHNNLLSHGRVVPTVEAYNEAQPGCREKRMVKWIVETSKSVALKWEFPIIDLEQLQRAQEFVSGGVTWHGLDLIDGDGSSERWRKRVWAGRIEDQIGHDAY